MLSAALMLGLLSVMAQKQQVMLDKVVAVVGGSSILYSEIDEYANQLKAQRRQEGYTSDRDPINEALEALLTQKLMYNQALIDSVAINSADIQSRIEEQVQYMVEDAGSILELESKFHMPIFAIRENMRQRYEEQAYANAMQGEVINKVTIIPGEVERFYKQSDKDSLPIIPEQFVYAQITKFPKSLVEAKQRAKERLLSMRERIIKGESKFESLARMYSIDPSAMQGGEMDPQPAQGFVQPFANALTELKPGQISEVVETEFGFHLIQLIDKRGNRYHCRHILLRPTYAMEEIVEPIQMLDSIADLIRKDSIKFEAAALKYSDDLHSKMNGGIVSNHDMLENAAMYDAKLSQTRFLKEDFGQRGFKSIDDYNAISRLKVGEISPAFSTEDMIGNQLCKIVKLVEIIPPHNASLNDDYLRLEGLALNAKQKRALTEWTSKKIDGMYVFITPEFRNGEFENKHWVK